MLTHRMCAYLLCEVYVQPVYPAQQLKGIWFACRMYEEIVGQKPQHHFFGARGSMLSYDVDVLRERLLAFIDLLGVEATHKMLSTEPHTLASTQQHLAANKAFLKKQLQLSDAQLSRLAAKAPR